MHGDLQSMLMQAHPLWQRRACADTDPALFTMVSSVRSSTQSTRSDRSSATVGHCGDSSMAHVFVPPQGGAPHAALQPREALLQQMLVALPPALYPALLRSASTRDASTGCKHLNLPRVPPELQAAVLRAMGTLTDVQSLTIHLNAWHDVQTGPAHEQCSPATQLARMPHVQHVELLADQSIWPEAGPGKAPASYEAVLRAAGSKLRSLCIVGTDACDDIARAAFTGESRATLSRLTALTLAETSSVSGSLQLLSLPALQRLELSGLQGNADQPTVLLQQVQRLTHVRLQDAQLARGTDCIETPPGGDVCNLQSLHLSYMRSLPWALGTWLHDVHLRKAVSPLASLAGLRELVLEDAHSAVFVQPSDAVLHEAGGAIAQMRALQSLRLALPRVGRLLQAVMQQLPGRNMDALTHLRLGAGVSELTEELSAMLPAFMALWPALRSIEVPEQRCRNFADFTRALAPLAALQSVVLRPFALPHRSITALRALVPQLPHLQSLSAAFLTDSSNASDMAQLARSLRACTQLSRLDVSGSRLQREACVAFVGGLQGSDSLQELHLGGCELGRGRCDVQPFADALTGMTQLRVLNMLRKEAIAAQPDAAVLLRSMAPLRRLSCLLLGPIAGDVSVLREPALELTSLRFSDVPGVGYPALAGHA